MDFKVDRSKWRRGGNITGLATAYGMTELINDKDNQCCLGFALEQCGVARECLKFGGPEEAVLNMIRCGTPIPDSVLSFVNIEDNYEADVTDSILSEDAIKINDSTGSDAAREAALQDLFIRHNHTISFYGEYLGGEIK